MELCKNCGTNPELVCDDCRAKIIQDWQKIIPFRFREQENISIKNTPKNFANRFLAKDKKFTGLFLYGETGTGKTTQLAVMCNYIFRAVDIKNRNQTCPVIWAHDQVLAFNIQWANAGRGLKSVAEIVDEIAAVSQKKLVIIDDLCKGSPKTNVTMDGYNLLIDQIYNNCGWLAIASNHNLEQAKEYIGYPAVERIIQMCGENIEEIAGESKRYG